MSLDGILDACLYEGSLDGEQFEKFVRNSLLPILKPFNYVDPYSVVSMDNASKHLVDNVRNLIENQAGALLLYLPPYSPDLTLIEEEFSQVKSNNKRNHDLFQVTTTPRALITMTFAIVEQEDCT